MQAPYYKVCTSISSGALACLVGQELPGCKGSKSRSNGALAHLVGKETIIQVQEQTHQKQVGHWPLWFDEDAGTPLMGPRKTDMLKDEGRLIL
jgi:hypothetical protein